MVKPVFSEDEAQRVRDAIAQAEQGTQAEIALVASRMSDPYYAYSLMAGFCAGSLIAVGAAWHWPVSLPVTLGIQMLGMVLFSSLPPLRRMAFYAVPPRQHRRRVHQRAAEEYGELASHLPPDVPLVLLYVSVGERMAHIRPCRRVREAVPAQALQDIINRLGHTARERGITDACVEAVQALGLLLEKAFPGEPGINHAPDLKQR